MDSQEKIIKKLGDNNTKTVVLRSTNPPIGIYTWRGEVCVLRDGMDHDFIDMEQSTQTIILMKIENDEYDLNEAFQG